MTVTAPLLIEPRSHDIGGLVVRRALPHAQARSVGPFVFFDHMGPVNFPAGQGIDVRPHPHIGLATVTYLFDGVITHRDSLGFLQDIRPGDVNWMTAGRGIVHSERTPAPERAAGHALHGIQTWVALPQADEEIAPSFYHHPASSLPTWSEDEGRVQQRLILGTLSGRESPAKACSPIFYVALEMQASGVTTLGDEHAERAIYIAAGALEVDGLALAQGQLLVLPSGGAVVLRAASPVRAMLFGGAPLDGTRFMWWNFVSSSRERIEQAKQEWREQRIGQVPGETEFIPLPDK